MTAKTVIEFLLRWAPLWFGLGFLAPLIAQSMEALGIPAPFGLPTITVGLLLGALGGVVAKRRGGWV